MENERETRTHVCSVQEHSLAIRDSDCARAASRSRSNEEARETTRAASSRSIGRGTIYMLIYMRLITMSDGTYRHALRAVPATD